MCIGLFNLSMSSGSALGPVVCALLVQNFEFAFSLDLLALGSLCIAVMFAVHTDLLFSVPRAMCTDKAILMSNIKPGTKGGENTGYNFMEGDTLMDEEISTQLSATA